MEKIAAIIAVIMFVPWLINNIIKITRFLKKHNDELESSFQADVKKSKMIATSFEARVYLWFVFMAEIDEFNSLIYDIKSVARSCQFILIIAFIFILVADSPTVVTASFCASILLLIMIAVVDLITYRISKHVTKYKREMQSIWKEAMPPVADQKEPHTDIDET